MMKSRLVKCMLSSTKKASLPNQRSSFVILCLFLLTANEICTTVVQCFVLQRSPATRSLFPRTFGAELNCRCWLTSSKSCSSTSLQLSAIAEREDKDEDQNDETFLDPVEIPISMEEEFSRSELESLTVQQLKQQLRLRGLKVSGRKGELVDRLLTGKNLGETVSKSDARRFAAERKKELVDVSEFIDEDDVGKDVKSSNDRTSDNNAEDNDTEHTSENSGDTRGNEVWGREARIVDDYEGREVVVDCISRSVVQYKGSNQTEVQAFVAASRDSLRPFLAGGLSSRNANANSAAEERVREIQERREKENKMPLRFEEDIGLDEGDETGLYANILERDFSDWGKYSVTGAQMSASETQGVLLLSDVYGAFSEDTKALAEKIAFECQPVVVMVPDLFRGEPWDEIESAPGMNSKGKSYEEWRSSHSELRVSVDIRAAAACLRERYGVSSVVVWGTCYGGGRALEAVAGYLPNGNIHDIDGSVGPPPVDPMAAVAWYPTRYDAKALFGNNRKETWSDSIGQPRNFAVMTVFAGRDAIPGATVEDASALKSLLEQDKRVKDHLVKVFPEQGHGFAHNGLGSPPQDEDFYEDFLDEEFGGAGSVAIYNGDADVACLLSTAFMETYSRVFLPTVGPPISEDVAEGSWNSELEMKISPDSASRDIRKEIADAVDSFVEEPLGGRMLDPTDNSTRAEMEESLRVMETDTSGTYKIDPDDDLETMYAKLKASDENFQLF